MRSSPDSRPHPIPQYSPPLPRPSPSPAPAAVASQRQRLHEMMRLFLNKATVFLSEELKHIADGALSKATAAQGVRAVHALHALRTQHNSAVGNFCCPPSLPAAAMPGCSQLASYMYKRPMPVLAALQAPPGCAPPTTAPFAGAARSWRRCWRSSGS